MERNVEAGSEDTAGARAHVENAADNRDALAATAAQDARTRPSTTAPAAPRQSATPNGRDAQNAQAAREVEENRDALEEQSRRIGTRAGVRSGAPAARDADNVEAAREVQENRDALAEQSRRIDASTPPDVHSTGPHRAGGS